MFTVGQRFSLVNSSAIYTIVAIDGEWLRLTWRHVFDRGESNYRVTEWQRIIDRGTVTALPPLDPAIAGDPVRSYLASLTVDDVFERELGRAIYQTMERWYNRGDYRDEFSQLCSAPNTPFDGKYLHAMACDKSKDG